MQKKIKPENDSPLLTATSLNYNPTLQRQFFKYIINPKLLHLLCYDF